MGFNNASAGISSVTADAPLSGAGTAGSHLVIAALISAQSQAGATDTTIVPGSAVQVFVTLTSAVLTVNRISQAGWVTGQRLTLHGGTTVAITLAHGVAAGGGFGSLLLYTATNIVMNQDSTVSFLFDGTNFVQDGYQIIGPG